MQKAKTDIIHVAAYDKPSLLVAHFEGCMRSNKFKPRTLSQFRVYKTSALVVSHNQVLYCIRNSQTG